MKFPLPDEEGEKIKSNWLNSGVALRKELDHLHSTLFLYSSLDQSSLMIFFSVLAPGRAHSFFSVSLPQVQITGPTFNGQEMEKGRMRFFPLSLF